MVNNNTTQIKQVVTPPNNTSIRPLLEMQQVYDLYPSTDMLEMMNLVFPIQIVSPVDITALQNAFQTLVERHDALRLTFIRQDGQVFQHIQGQPMLNFGVVDASSLSNDELQQRLSAVAQQPFDLEQDNTFLRVRLFKQTANRAILLIIAHHIVVDGQSMFMLLNELRILYQAYATGQVVSLPMPKKTFWDYIDWYTAKLSGPKGERLWKYWQTKLAGELPILNLPTDYPRPSTQTHCGDSYHFKISSDFTETIKTFSKTKKTTPYTTMLTAYYALLHAYTGETDILVATTASNRIHDDFSKTVGCIADSIVLRATWFGDPSFQDLLTIVKTDAFQTLYHREYPFNLLVENFAQKQDRSYPLLCQASFLYLKPLPEFQEGVELLNPKSPKTINFGGLTVKHSSGPVIWVGSWRDVLFDFVEGIDNLFGHCNYNTDLFKERTIIEMVNCYLEILAKVVANPTIRLSEISRIAQQRKM